MAYYHRSFFIFIYNIMYKSMKQSFLDFVKERKENEKNYQTILEAFKEADIEKALDKIDNVLSDHIDGLVPLVGFVKTNIDGKECTSKQYLINTKEKQVVKGFQFNWLNSGNSYEVYSIDFFKDITKLLWDGKAKSDLTIKTLGTSVVTFLPVVWDVMNNNKYDITKDEVKDDQKKVFKGSKVKESLYTVRKNNYRFFEGLDDDIIVRMFKINERLTINEGSVDPELAKYKQKKKEAALNAYAHRNDSKAASEKNDQLWDEYNEIVRLIDEEGITTMDELQCALSKGSKVEILPSQNEIDNEKEIQGKKDAEQVFKEMSKYIKMVITGIQPSLIICGAPGVGKTFRVKKQLKEAGYKEGTNMMTVKGKCTPRALYNALYEMRKKNNILMIDDADGLVGPNAPEDSINILKAALDSTSDDEGRLITYGIAGKITNSDGVELPKRFYYNGGVIILTNWQAGKLDSALRGRSFIQDINFTTKEVLEIIYKLLPSIEPERYTAECKKKAYDFLMKLYKEGSDMELSLRTFTICVKMYQTADGDNTFTDDDVESMIIEQMKLQSRKGGDKY